MYTQNKKWICLLAMAAGGCAQHSQSVDRRMVLPPFADVLQVRDDQHFLMAAPIENPAPEFPGALVKGHLQLEVCAVFNVLEDGSVAGVTIARDTAQCAAGSGKYLPAFEESVVTALSRWTFFGAAVCSFPPGTPKNSECRGEGVQIDPVRIKLRYVFSFEQIRGRRTTGSRPAN